MTSARRAISRWAWASSCALLALALAAPLAAGGGTPKPVIEPARGGKCIAPRDQMRRTHMKLLLHQREETVRRGVRGAKVSLQRCVECHASRATGSVAASKDDFCESCHSYAAVKLDCFECHSSRPKTALRRSR